MKFQLVGNSFDWLNVVVEGQNFHCSDFRADWRAQVRTIEIISLRRNNGKIILRKLSIDI